MWSKCSTLQATFQLAIFETSVRLMHEVHVSRSVLFDPHASQASGDR